MRGGSFQEDIAIIGMACLFPGAASLDQYWRNILGKVDSTSEAPADWGGGTDDDSTYCTRGGFLGALATFDPSEFGVIPDSVDGCGADHFLALRVAHAALQDAGYGSGDRLAPLRARTGVVIGCGTYFNRGNVTVFQRTLGVEGALNVLASAGYARTAEERAALRRKLKEALPAFNPDTVPGQVPNTIAGRIANRLDLMGPSYIVDAACASSLIALGQAMDELRSGRCDMVLAGGVHAAATAPGFILFSKLRALSAKGRVCPFDADADGTLVGEGAGVLVLRRATDAARDHDRVYAIVKAVGTASDGRGAALLAPRAQGERLALERAYEQAGVDPLTVALIEGHGTATPIGDETELRTLHDYFGERVDGPPRCALGSVKSMIGHTMPAAGAAGLIKAALALHQKVLPPTIHCDSPRASVEWGRSRIYINTEARPWIHGSDASRRRAAVNAFGFGGINAHAVLEEAADAAVDQVGADWECELVLVSADDVAGLARAASELADVVDRPGAPPLIQIAEECSRERLGKHRLAVVADSSRDLANKLRKARERLGELNVSRIRDASGIYYAAKPLAPQGGLAFCFPGEGAQYEGMLADLAMSFPCVRDVFDQIDRAFESQARAWRLGETVFPPPGSGDATRMWRMETAIESVLAANAALGILLSSLGITPNAVVGHSTGEYSALFYAAGPQPLDAVTTAARIRELNRAFERSPEEAVLPPAGMLAVGGGAGLARSLLAESAGRLHLALDNCEEQLVLCGDPEAVDHAGRHLAASGALCQVLPFDRPYHSPMFEQWCRPLEDYLAGLDVGSPRCPIYSCATTERFPDDADSIRRLALSQWTRTVRFRETVEAMYRDGIRIFIEVGPRGNLAGAIAQTLAGRPHLAVPANLESRSGLRQLNTLLGMLAANHVDVNFAPLYERRLMRSRDVVRVPAGKPLNTALPVLGGIHGVIAERPVGSELEMHWATMESFLETQRDTVLGYLSTSSASRRTGSLIDEVMRLDRDGATVRKTFRLDRDLYLRDHTLGRNVSATDSTLGGLAIVPFTITLELMAEAASLLAPSQTVAGVRALRQHRWIAVKDTAEVIVRVVRAGPGEFDVTVHSQADPPAAVAEARIRFGSRPSRRESPDPRKPVRADLYGGGMFHGPRFQGVRAIESTADGAFATLSILPHSELIAGERAPRFHLDPVLLDAAGQVLGFWAIEQWGPTASVFPFQLDSLECFETEIRDGSDVHCMLRVCGNSESEVACDFEMMDEAGRVLYAARGWTDRRLTVPASFSAMRITPQTTYLSERWAAPGAFGRRLRLPEFSFLNDAQGLWREVLAFQTLGRGERSVWDALPAEERQAWLLGRCAAKDSVRESLQERSGRQFHPADVQIVDDGPEQFKVRVAGAAIDAAGRLVQQEDFCGAQAWLGGAR